MAQGRTLRLSDVATVERGYEDPATFMVRNQGEPALLLGIIMRDGWNGLDLGKALDEETARINQGMPLGMTLTKVTDQSVNISSAVDEFMVKFFVALLVVMVVCFVSMGWRGGGGGAAAGRPTLGGGFFGGGGIISMAIMASSTSKPSARIREPSVMRSKFLPEASITTKTTASVSGTAAATTTPTFR